jgi:hypothetical protein
MMLIVWYVLLMVVGDLIAYFIGEFAEYEFGSQVSLVVFLALYFAMLWLAWIIAVRLTAPRKAQAAHAKH